LNQAALLPRAEDAVENCFLGFPDERHGDGERREAEEKQDGDFRAAIESDPDVTKYLRPQAIQDSFSVSRQLRNIDQIFQRVFQK